MEESTNKAKLITDNCISKIKKKKTYAEAVDSGNSNINEGIKCGKNCTVLTVNKHDALVPEAAIKRCS